MQFQSLILEVTNLEKQHDCIVYVSIVLRLLPEHNSLLLYYGNVGYVLHDTLDVFIYDGVLHFL